MSKRVPDLFLWYFFFSVGYLSAAYLQGEPRFFPALPVDALIPFVPAFLLVYLSQYALLILAALRTKDPGLFFRRLYLVSAIGFFCFVVFPTRFDRPSPDNVLFEILYQFDPPVNCFPSLHAAIALISAVALGAWALPWATGIAISTVLTKQHFVVDTIAGLLLGGVVCWMRVPKSASVSR